MGYKQNLFGIILFALACCLIMASTFKIISVAIPVVLGFSLILYSVPALYMAMEKSRRLQIISSAFLFFTGLILIIIKLFEVLDPLKVIFPSVIFITGVIFYLLYLDNHEEKAFLYAGMFAAVIGIISALSYKHFALFYFTDKILMFLSGYWHIILIIAGIMLLINRNRK